MAGQQGAGLRIRPRVTALVVSAAALALATTAAALGQPWLLCATLAVLWWPALSRSVGRLMAVAWLAVGFPALVLGVALAAPLTGVRLDWALIVVAVLVGGAAAWLNATRHRGTPLSRREALGWGAAVSVGAIAWLGAYVAARASGGGAIASWAMRNDSAPHFMYAREIVEAGGITAASFDHDPVPLVHALIAAVLGRDVFTAGASVRSDLWSFSLAWMVLMCAASVVSAVAVIALSGASARSRPTAVALLAACGAALHVTWFVSGYPIDFGFVNAPLVFLIAGASLIALARADEHPAAALALQGVSGTLLLAVWSPLVVIPAALAAAIAVRRGAAVLRAAKGERVVLALSCVQFVAYAVAVEVPIVLHSRQALGNAGGLAEFPRVMLPCVAAALVLVVLWSRALRRSTVGVGLVALACGALAGLVAVISMGGGTLAGAWQYYPHKYAWLVTAMLLTVALGLAARAAGHAGPRQSLVLVGAPAAAVVVMAGGLAWVPIGAVQRVSDTPLAGIVAGSAYGQGDAIADAVATHSEGEAPRVVWATSSEADRAANFWLVQLAGEGYEPEARAQLFALAHQFRNPADLCGVAEPTGRAVEVVVLDGTPESDVRAACPPGSVAAVVRQGD